MRKSVNLCKFKEAISHPSITLHPMPSTILSFLKYAGQNECYSSIRYRYVPILRTKNLLSGISIRAKFAHCKPRTGKILYPKSTPGTPYHFLTSVSNKTSYFWQLSGTSVLMYRDSSYRDHQWFTFSDWPGGIYATPTISGSRAGGVIAATWAAMVRYAL